MTIKQPIIDTYILNRLRSKVSVFTLLLISSICVANSNTLIDEVITTPASDCVTADGMIEITTLITDTYTYTLQPAGGTMISNMTGTFTNLLPGNYLIEVISATCTDQEFVQLSDFNDLTAYFDPNLVSGNSLTVCDGEVVPAITVMTNHGVTFSWVETLNPTIVLSTQDTYTPLNSGLHQVIVADANGCTENAFVDVQFNDAPEIILPADVTICEFDDYILESNAISGIYVWTFDGSIIPNANTNNITVSNPGQYILEAYNFSNCSDIDTFNLSLLSVPQFDLGDDQIQCEGSMLSFDVGSSIFINSPTYAWIAPDNSQIGDTPIIVIDGSDGSGDYSLTVMDNDSGCEFTDVVNLEFSPNPTIELNRDAVVLCDGESVTIIAQSSLEQIDWTLNGNALLDQEGSTVTLDQEGELIAQVGFGSCTASDTVQITISDIPIVLLGNQDVISGCQGDELVLDASNETALFDWYFNGILVENDGDDEFTAAISGEYVARTMNDAGCTNSDTVTVNLESTFPIDIGRDTIVCGAVGYTLVAQTESDLVAWYYNPTTFPLIPNEFVATGNTYTCEADESGYYIAQSIRGDCLAYDTVLVTKLVAPSIFLPSQQFICGSSGSIEVGTSAQDGVTYEWFLNTNDPPVYSGNEVVFDNQGFYTLIATNEADCSSEATISIRVAPLDFELGFSSVGVGLTPINDTIAVCGNSALNVTATTTNSSEFATYNWFTDLSANPIESQSNSLSINDNTDRTYYVEMIHFNSGCTSIDSFYVDYEVPPIITIPDITICDGESTMVATELEEYEHIWIRDNIEIEGQTTNQLTVSQGGTYFVGAYLMDENCLSEIEFDVSVLPSPTILDLEDKSICSDESTTLQVVSDGNYTYQWYRDDNIVIGGTENSLEIDEGGLYEVIVTTSGGCSDTLQSTVLEGIIDALDLGFEEINLCPGESIVLTPLEGTFANYAWSTGEVTSSITLEAQAFDEITVQDITLTVDNGEDCMLTSEVTVINFPAINADIRANINELCPNDTFQMVAIGGLYYNWTEDIGSLNATDTASVIATPEIPTWYVVEVTDDCPLNFDIDSLFVDVFPLSEISAGQDTFAYKGFASELGASGGLEYQWSDPELIQGSNQIPNPTIVLEEANTFSVTITDEFGCMYTDSIFVSVKDQPEDLIDIVTIITPNGDGKNDELWFNGLEAYPSNTITIYNRWGNVVYSAFDYQVSGDSLFDGTNGADELAADTYFYIIEFEGNIVKETLTITRE